MVSLITFLQNRFFSFIFEFWVEYFPNFYLNFEWDNEL